MIRKFLVIANRISLASTRRDSVKSTGPMIELLMPADVYWQIEEELKQYDAKASSGDDGMVLAELNKKIMLKLTAYVVHEKERLWLRENAESEE